MTEVQLPSEWTLKITLLTDTAPGRGEGVAGLVDSEIDHDEFGLPYFHGRRIKGLLSAQCAEILGALRAQSKLGKWEMAANALFGEQGANSDTPACVTFGHANLPSAVRAHLRDASPAIGRSDTLNALTVTRRQTRVDPVTGAAADKSLRSTRAIRRNLTFTSRVWFAGQADEALVGLLAACATSLRHVGMHRWRGMGLVKVTLSAPGCANPLDFFEKEAR